METETLSVDITADVEAEAPVEVEEMAPVEEASADATEEVA